MQALFRCLLYLYPAEFSREFAKEMTWVFSQVQQDFGKRGVRARVSFFIREVSGMLAEGLRQRFGGKVWFSLRRFNMRPFRFSRIGMVVMIVALVGVLVAIEKARAISAQSIPELHTVSTWTMVQGVFGFLIVTMAILGLIGYVVLRLVSKSGADRLSNIQTWSRQK
jgi:FtsH-binding integral membrane protein